MEIVIIVDSSEAIGPTTYKIVRDFVANVLIHQFGTLSATKVRIAYIDFNERLLCEDLC